MTRQASRATINQCSELQHKAEALAQRTILENFELRVMINDVRDENFHLRNEIYDLQDKMTRQSLTINKFEKMTGTGVDTVELEGVQQLQQAHTARVDKIAKQLEESQRVAGGLKATRAWVKQRVAFVESIEQYLGLSIVELIPKKLNGQYRRFYQRLFRGYCRRVATEYQFHRGIPPLVAQITSDYYPWFLGIV